MNKIYIGMGTCGLAVGAAKVKDVVGRWAEARGRQLEVTPTWRRSASVSASSRSTRITWKSRAPTAPTSCCTPDTSGVAGK